MATKQDLERLLIDNKITRRDFIERMAAIGAVAAIPGALQSAQAATPKRGGRLRAGASQADTRDSFHPDLCCQEHIGMIIHMVRNKLVDMGPGLKPIGDLAESWDVSPDAATWTFKLRKGVEYHQGGTVTPQDVVWSINHHRGEDSKSPAKPLLAQITDVKAKGNDAVEFQLEAGNADFVAVLTDPHALIIPAETAWEDGNGTGPFVLDSFEPGVRFFGKRNPNYFREGQPYFDEVELLGINDPVTRVNALRTGEVDVIDHPDPKTTRLLQQDPNLQVVQLKGLRHFTMPMLMDTPPYDNNDVRLALKYAVDRRELVDKVLRNLGEVGNDHPIGSANRYHATLEEIPQREYDPDKAKFHLKKGGAEGYTFKLSTSEAAFGEAVDFAVLVKEHAAVAGIDIEIERMPIDGYWDEVWIKHEWCMSFWSGRPTEDWMFSQAYSSGAAWNESRFEHERFNKLLKEARIELNDTLRREMYVEMQRILHDEGGSVVPAFNDQVMAATRKLQFTQPLRVHRMWDGYNGPERWWFA